MATIDPVVTEGGVDPTSGALEPEAALELVLNAAHRPAETLWTALEDRIESLVRGSIREALARHGEHLEAAGLTGDLPEDAEVASEALRSYRHAVADQVFPHLELALEHHEPTLLMAREVAAAFEEARASSSALPPRSDVRWGAGALEVLPTDTVGRKVSKILARVLSKARKPAASRPAPLRAVALHHLEARIAPVLADAVADGVRGWAGWLARLERVCADWADEVLPILTRIDVPTASPAPDEEEAVDPDETEAADGLAEQGRADTWERLRTAAETFSTRLEELLEASPHEEARARAEGRLAPAVIELSSDVRVVGSFVYRAPGAGVADPRLVSLDRVRKKFENWDAQAAARLHMYRAFLEILRGSRAVVDRLEARARGAILERLTDLEGSLAELEALVADTRSRASDDDLVSTLPALRARAEEVAERAMRAFPDVSAVDEALEGIVSDAVDALQAIIRQSPRTLTLHRLPEGASSMLRPEDTRSVSFQESARQSWDAMRIERIRAGVLELGAGLVPVRASLAELPDVLAFAFDAAQSEADGEETEVLDDDEEGDPDDRAARLALEALERSASVVSGIPAQVEKLLDRTRDNIDAEVVVGAEALLDRLGAGRMQSQLLRARSSFSELWLRLLDRVGPTVRWARRAARYRFLRSRRAARRLQHAVRGLVGEAPVSDARAARTIRAFAHADYSGAGHVPLVYQRLFSMEPVTDASFLVGRAAELADVLKRWRRWQEEDEVPLVVRGYPGVGVSSFLNGCASLLAEQGATVVRMQIPERVLEEGPLASLVASVLDVGTEDGLAALARRILAVRRGGTPDVVVLDGLEHVYLRIPHGTDLLERLLTLMSETEPRTFWLAGVGQPAWQLLGKVEPTAVSQVDVLQLPPLTADRLKETILQRHRRSGLRLRFLEPQEGRALLRRRARRLRGTEGHQRLLEADFFEQLHRISVGNLKLAMFHWLLAADFEAKEGEVLIHPLVRPDFSVLEGLSDTQNFTLKALLEHRTLTLDEYCRILRVGRQESYQIFESLQNRRLVEEMAPPKAVTSEGSELERSSRYRIRPLLVGAVTAHLRKRNIVH